MEHCKETYANNNGWLAGGSQIKSIVLFENIVLYSFAKLWFQYQNWVHSAPMIRAMAMIWIDGEVLDRCDRSIQSECDYEMRYNPVGNDDTEMEMNQIDGELLDNCDWSIQIECDYKMWCNPVADDGIRDGNESNRGRMTRVLWQIDTKRVRLQNAVKTSRQRWY